MTDRRIGGRYPLGNRLPQCCHLRRKLRGPRRRLASPEGDVGRGSVSVLHPHLAHLYALDAPGGVSQQHNVAGQTLHRKVFIDRSHDRSVRLRDHGIVCRVRNGPAGRDRRKAGPSSAFDTAIDPIMEQIGQASPAIGRNPVRQHPQHLIELRTSQGPIGIGPPTEIEQLVFLPGLRGRCCHQLLRQNIERSRHHGNAIQNACPNRAHQRRTFEQVIPRHREQSALGNGLDPVTGPANPLQTGGNRAGRTDLTDKIHGADIDAEFQRGRGNDDARLAALKPFFRRQANLAREAAMVCRNDISA
ncbi:MAG: hypothetical protein EWM73_03717 [Nitrospira sp.]|nr:MAG: hypothetical protein EWM73_03717 [Nitrospira sp.]